MTREELINQCHFYKGEDENPFLDKLENPVYLWQAERTYVKHGGTLDKEMDGYYKRLGGKEFPDIPRPLLITMFAYWTKGADRPETELQTFYGWCEDYIKKGGN